MADFFVRKILVDRAHILFELLGQDKGHFRPSAKAENCKIIFEVYDRHPTFALTLAYQFIAIKQSLKRGHKGIPDASFEWLNDSFGERIWPYATTADLIYAGSSAYSPKPSEEKFSGIKNLLVAVQRLFHLIVLPVTP
ncbi:MAG TPA: hypothetical protein VFM05_02970 [Candidatus Saccharimonadales bacterium]|nr:hypothetical protein [Candidatus Saccharimonadales bacterium]